MMRHLIITRLGIGIARPSYFAQQIEVTRAGLHRSLRAQTCQDFEWVICADARIDEANRENLRALVSDVPGRLVLFDPIETLRMMPAIGDILTEAGDAPLLTTRIDNDDALHREFVERIQAVARDCDDALAAITLADGLYCYQDRLCYRQVHEPRVSAGMSLLSRDVPPKIVYRENHTRLHAAVTAEGGRSIVVRSETPMWFYVIRSTSESGAIRKGDEASRQKPCDGFFYEALREGGLEADWMFRASDIYRRLTDPRPPVLGDRKLMRIHVKSQMLSLMAELRRTGDEDGDRFAALMSAFYAF